LQAQFVRFVRAILRCGESIGIEQDNACINRLRRCTERKIDVDPSTARAFLSRPVCGDELHAIEQAGLTRWRAVVEAERRTEEGLTDEVKAQLKALALDEKSPMQPAEEIMAMIVEPVMALTMPDATQPPRSFVPPTSTIEDWEPQPHQLPQTINLEPTAHIEPTNPYQLSDSASREVLRLQLKKRGHIARSLALATTIRDPDEPDPDTQLANDWNVSGASSLHALHEEPLLPTMSTPTVPIGRNGNGSHYTDDSLSSHMDTAEPSPIVKPIADQPAQTPAKPEGQKSKGNFHSRANPYRHYSDTALMLLAQSANTQPSALVWLCLHSNPDIRGAVARNTNCPQEALSVLAKDHEAGIRHALAENPRSPISVLEFLANDKNPLIAWRAQNNLNAARGRRTVTDVKLPDWQAIQRKQAATTHHKLPYSDELCASEETIAFLKLIARRTNTPARRLSELSRHPDPRVRASVSENANTPLELLWLLAKDNDQEVRLKITENYNCPVEILEALREDSDPYVAWQARSVINKINNGGPALDSYVNQNALVRPAGVISRELK
jgi:hypothetical protein